MFIGPMSVMTILLMTMLSFCQRASNFRKSRWPWTAVRSWRSWRRGSPPPSWSWRRTPPPSRGCWAGSDADFGLGEIFLREFFSFTCKGQLNSIDSMQLNQSNSTLGHKGRVTKKDMKSMTFVLQLLVGTFPGLPNTHFLTELTDPTSAEKPPFQS